MNPYQKLGNELIQALGLPEHCTSMQLNLSADDGLKVKCEYIPNIKAEPMRRALKLLTLARFTENEEDCYRETAFELDAEIAAARQRIHQMVDRDASNALRDIHYDALFWRMKYNDNTNYVSARISAYDEMAILLSAQYNNKIKNCVNAFINQNRGFITKAEARAPMP